MHSGNALWVLFRLHARGVIKKISQRNKKKYSRSMYMLRYQLHVNRNTKDAQTLKQNHWHHKHLPIQIHTHIQIHIYHKLPAYSSRLFFYWQWMWHFWERWVGVITGNRNNIDLTQSPLSQDTATLSVVLWCQNFWKISVLLKQKKKMGPMFTLVNVGQRNQS